MPEDSPARTGGDDWTYAVTDQLETVVGTIRDKTTVPVLQAARYLILSVVLGALGAVALIFGVILLVRLLDLYLPIHPESRRVWIIYALVGAIIVGIGAFLWSKRQPKPH